MIDEIFQEYKKQENENITLLTRHYGIEVKQFLYPNMNNDLILILDSANLLKGETKTFHILDEFYEKIIKEGILLGLGFGKAHMIKKIIEMPLKKSDIIGMDLTEYDIYYPQFEESNYDAEKIDENGIKRLKVLCKNDPTNLDIEIAAVAYMAKIIDRNHKELKKMLFEEFLDEFKIDRKKAKFTCNKRIRIDGEKLKPSLQSGFYKEKAGKHKIKNVIDEYFEFLIDMGMDLGIRTGLKLVLEDIQKDVMPYEILRNLSETETMMYIQKEHSEYIFKKHKNQMTI